MAMVIAAHRAGGPGFLATGYKTPEAVQAELDAIREESLPFGVNVFVPNPTPIQPERYRRYATPRTGPFVGRDWTPARPP